jgi:VWFA-related protein
MRNKLTTAVLIAVLAMFSLAFTHISTQEKKTQELKHEVTVTLKLIQVYVTDSSGNPVTDLKLEEFRIYDNKELQKITDFERYVLDLPETAESPEPDKEETAPGDAAKEIMNRKFFLFFDMVNNNYKGFKKSQEAALHFLDNQVQPEDEVGVISFSVLKQLTLHEYLTTDHEIIRDVVKQIGGEGRVGRAENFEAMRYSEMSGEQLLDPSVGSQPVKEGAPAHLRQAGAISKSGWDAVGIRPDAIATNDRFLREEHKNISQNLMLRFIDLSKSLRYISGHKHIVLFSSGIPYSLIHGIETTNPFQSFQVGMDTNLRDKYEDMLKELSDSNTTIFSVNTEPLATNMNLPAHMKGEVTLRRMSQDTGGKFIGNVQNYSQILETVQTFTGSYYVLGYYVDESWDGRYHPIEVKVSRGGCSVFAQRGYFNPKPYSEYNAMEKELHLIDLALSDRSLMQIPVDIPMAALPCSVEDESGVCLLAQIHTLRIKESLGEKAELYFLVFDEEENLKSLKRKEVKLAALKDEEAYYYSLMPLAPGAYKFCIVMRDMDSGSGGVGRYFGEIPQVEEQNIQLYAPLLLTPGKSGFFVRGDVPKSGEKKFPLLDSFPFDPAEYSPAMGRYPQGTKTITAVMRCALRNLDKPALRFTAVLKDKNSQRSYSLPLSILSAKKAGDIGTLLVELQAPELPAGDYLLALVVEDTVSQAHSQTSVPCEIY